MTWVVILALILVGFIFLLLEVLVVPGTTVIGFIGAAMMAFGVYSTYAYFGAAAGTYTLAGTLIFSAVALTMAFKSNSWKIAMLDSKIDGKVNLVDIENVKPGDEGITITRLNPMGKALINNEYYEVTSRENLIDPDTKIVILKVDGNQIIVKSKTE